MYFSNDEINLMCIYDTGTRKGLIEALVTMRMQLEENETELMRITDSTLTKLNACNDDEYELIELYPDFGEE